MAGNLNREIRFFSSISLLFLATVLSSFPALSQTSINISGLVMDKNWMYVPDAKVVAIKEIDNDRIDSTFTDGWGDYHFSFVLTAMTDKLNPEAKIFPNPYTDKTIIQIFVHGNPEYILKISDLTGRLVLKQTLNLHQGSNIISITGGKPGVNIIDLTNGTEKHTYKAVYAQGTDNPLSANVTKKEGINASSNNSYSNNSSNGSFKSGSTNLEDMMLKLGDYVRLEFTKTGYYNTDTTFILSENNYINKQMLKIYSHYINGNAKSNITNKIIKDNTQIYIVKPASTDTTWVNTINGLFNYSWTDANESTNVKIGSKNIPGHSPLEINANIYENENINITFTGLIYNLSQPILVNNQYNEAVTNAKVTGGDETKYTDATGKTTITKSNLETDINNLPLNNYSTPLTVTKDNIQTLNQTINSNVGTNTQQLLNIIQEYIHFLWGNSTTPTGTIVKAWKDGTPINTGTVNGTNYETNHTTRTTKTFTADSITFEKPGYTTFKENNTILVDGGNKKEATLSQIQTYKTLNFTLKVFRESGEIINTIKPNFSNTIQWPDGTTNNYPVTAQGEIIVNKILPYNNNTFKTATISNDTTDYNGNGVLSWTILREPHQKTNKPNIAQNQSTNLIPEHTTTIPLDSLANKTIYEYTIIKKAEGQPGVWYRMDKYPASGFIRTSGDGRTSKFIQIPTNIAQYVDFVQKGWNETTGEAIPQADLDRSDFITNQIISINYLANSDTIFPPHRMYTVANTSDPRWQELIARGLDNSVRSIYYVGTQINGREWTLTYSYNGEPRIWRTSAKYNTSTGNGTMFSEKYSATYGIEEGTGPSLSLYVYNATTDEPSELGKAMARTAQLLNLGTK